MSREDELPRTVADTVEAARTPGVAGATFERGGARFVLGGELGRGGMGRVVEATDVALGRTIAIKQVLSDSDDVLARFEREVRVTAQLEHPSIVPVHEAGRGEDGKPYYVMRRIAGESLDARIRNAAAVRDRLALLPSVVAVVDAAAFAHARGVIHRDIKPPNIMLGRFGEAHLIDWGLARRLDEREANGAGSSGDDALTQAGDVYGTVAYMAPEQARGEVVDERADVFALGATLFHLLAGRAPFANVTLAERIAGHRDIAFDAIHSDVPRELIAIVEKAMAPDLDVRYRDAGALAADLHAFLAGQLVAAHHYTVRQRLVRFLRRHRLVVALTAGLVAVGTVLGVLALGNIVRARDEARHNEQLARDGEAQALLARASALTDLDPTEAVLLLRTLEPGSAYAARARDIAAAAAAQGIAHGRAPGTSALGTHVISSAVLSPDGMRLATAGMPGRLTIHDLATGSGRTILTLPRIAQLVWGHPSTVVVADGAMLSAVDVATGARRELVASSTTELWTGTTHDRVRYLDPARRELREISIAGGEPITLVSDVDMVVGEGDLAMYYATGALWILEGDHGRRLYTGAPPSSSLSLAVSRSRGRVAAALQGAVREWNLEGVELRSWPIGSHRIAYGGDGLFAQTPGGVARLGGVVNYLSSSATRVTFIANLGDGYAFVENDGTVAVIGPHSRHRLTVGRDVSALRVVTSQRSPFIVATLNNGGLMWWDRRALLPDVVATDPRIMGNICWVDERWIVMHAIGQLVVIDRLTGAVNDRIADELAGGGTCRGTLDDNLYLEIRQEHVRVDLRTRDITSLPHRGPLAVDPRSRALVYARGRDLVVKHDGVERVRWTAPGPIERVAVADPWIAVAGPGFVARVAPDGGSDLVAGVLPETIGVLHDGAVFWATSILLTWWRDGRTYPPQPLHAPIMRWSTSHGGVGLVLRNRSVWYSTPRELASRAPSTARPSGLGFGARAARGDPNVNEVTVHSLATGVVSRHQLLYVVNDAAVGPAGEAVALTTNTFLTWRDPVPPDARDLDAWIDASTNARMDSTTKALLWPPWPD